MAIASPVQNVQPSELSYWSETSRDYLDIYGRWVHGHRPARHHREWIDRISALVAGQSAKRKLLIIAPPGHAKSTWVSLIFPPWYLGNHTDHSLLLLTSNDTMARQFGGTIKTTLEGSDRHIRTFPRGEARPDVARGWSTDGLYLKGVPAGSKDPSYRALGYGASVIGARAHGIILDDPMTQEQAQSAVEQEKAKRYHDMTVDSRLHPGGWELGIMTRWHENDLASHLMAKPDWDTLAMPAVGYWGEGEALWPERFGAEWLEAKRADIGGALFAALYLGDTTAMGGSVFKSAAWFRPLPSDFHEPRDDGKSLRQRLRVVQFWDLAYSDRDSANYTAGVTLGVDAVKNLYILGVFRKRLTPAEVEVAMVEQAELHRPDLIGVEESAFKQAAVHDLIGRVHRRALVGIVAVKPSADKVTRALLPAARAEAGLVYGDRAAPWWPVFEAELLGFPLAEHDDQTDGLSGATQLAIERLGTLPDKPTGYGFAGPKARGSWVDDALAGEKVNVIRR